MMYVWNSFTIIACCESLLNSVLDRVNATLAEFDRLDRHQRRRYFYDDYCLAMLIKGTCLRHKRDGDEALDCFHAVAAQ